MSLQQWKGTVCSQQHTCSWQVKGPDTPLYLTPVKPHLQHWVQFGALQYNKDIKKLKQFWWMDPKKGWAGAHDARGKAEGTALVESRREKAERKDLKVFLYLTEDYREHKTRVL